MITVGMLIQYTQADNEWIAKVLEIDEDANELEVFITSVTSGQWAETWNLAHTRSAFDQGEYVSIGKCDD